MLDLCALTCCGTAPEGTFLDLAPDEAWGDEAPILYRAHRSRWEIDLAYQGYE